MSEEPSLPSLSGLPKVSWDSHTQTFTNTRKRNRDGATPQPLFNSSDPAVFSSDDDPDVENYISGRRRKKRYVGSWFQQLPTSSDSTFSEATGPRPKPNRKLKRQWDSGVWMGSDGSVDLDEDEGFPMDVEQPVNSKLPQSRNPCRIPSVNPQELSIRTRIEAAIEDGNPEIDLSSVGITTIPDEYISRLNELTLIPSVDKDVPFEQTNPKLGLYLSNNILTHAPPALFRVENLTYLSIRNNKVADLPPSISELRNLRELNLSLNRLHYLPGELLGLLKFPSVLSSLRVHPNPFYQPEQHPPLDTEFSDEVRDEEFFGHVALVKGDDGDFFSPDDYVKGDRGDQPVLEIDSCAWQMVFVARSPIQYSDSRGSVLSKFQLPSGNYDTQERQHFVIPIEDASVLSVPHFVSPIPDCSEKPSHVLSLFELAMKSASRAAQTWDLASYLSPDVPPSVRQGIDRITAQREFNGNTGTVPCSVCGRQVTTPVTQWIEWWDLSKVERRKSEGITKREPLSKDAYENAIPFLKRGCSWNCVPKPMKVGQHAPGSFVSKIVNMQS